MLGSGHNNTTLIVSNDEMDDILKIVKSLEDSGVLLKGVSETIQHEAKEQRGGFLSMLLGMLGASLLGDVLSKGLSGTGVIRADEGAIRAGYGSKRSSLKRFRLLHHTLQQTLKYKNIIKMNLDLKELLVDIINLVIIKIIII